MAITLLSDVIVPEIFTRYIRERTALLSAFIRSGAFLRDAEWDKLLQGGGELFQMPFWKPPGGSDDLIDSGTSLTVERIQASKDAGQRLIRGKGFGTEDIAGILAGDDPFQALGDYIGDWWKERTQETGMATLKGVFSAASMSDLTSIIYAGAGDPITDETSLNAYTFIDSVGKLGDAEGGLSLIAMHSDTERSLRKDDLIETVRDSQSGQEIKTYQGKEIIVDDTMGVETINGHPVYTTYVMARGAVAWGENTTPKDAPGGAAGDWYQELSRDPARGASYIWTRRDMMYHPRGIRFTQASMVGSTPTNLELANGTNWERVWDKKHIRMVQIRHNIQ